MYPAFDKLPEEKKDFIRNICIEEFARNGYEHTSTDTITRRAGISKGILFHYFKSKRNLYIAVLEYVLGMLTDITLEAVSTIESNDFFERIKEIVLVKQQIMVRHFDESHLLIDALANPPKALKSDIDLLLSKHYERFGGISSRQAVYRADLLQAVPLREGLSADTVFQICMTYLEQISARQLQLYKMDKSSIDGLEARVIQEIDDFFKIVKYGIYKS